MDIKLETLLQVNEKKNFTRAAEALFLTQPAVSHHISALEEEYGVKIFLRSGPSLKLTPEGEILVKYAKRIKALYGQIKRELTEGKEGALKILIGVTRTVESGFFAEALAKYGRDKPGGAITLISDTANNLQAMLANYDIDLAIVEGGTGDGEMNSLRLDRDYLVCVVSNDNPLAAKGEVTLEDLKKERMILRLPNSGTRNLFIAHLESAEMSINEFNVILEVDNIATIKDLVRKDMGVSILARSACLDELSKGKITALSIENLSMARDINILYRKDFAHEHILRDIASLYRETVKFYQ